MGEAISLLVCLFFYLMTHEIFNEYQQVILHEAINNKQCAYWTAIVSDVAPIYTAESGAQRRVPSALCRRKTLHYSAVLWCWGSAVAGNSGCSSVLGKNNQRRMGIGNPFFFLLWPAGRMSPAKTFSGAWQF